MRTNRLDEERVLLRPRGVISIRIQRVKIEPLILELWAFRNLPAHTDEDVTNVFHEKVQWMPCARAPSRSDRRNIYRFGLKLSSLLNGRKFGFTHLNCLTHLSTSLPNELAGCRLLIVGHVAELGVQRGETRGLTGMLQSSGL